MITRNIENFNRRKKIRLSEDVCNIQTENSYTFKTQWGRLISCLPQLDSVDLVAFDLVLGRSENCDIVIHRSKFLEDELFYVSKQHFIIQRDFEDEYIVYIHDLSKNGTYVNDVLVGRQNKIILQNNDTIAIGNNLKVYIYKSMNYPVEENFVPAELNKKYVTSRLLGTGGCGQVRLVYDKITCQQYALKKIIKSRDTPSQIHNVNHPQRVETEICILEGLSHPLIVRTKEVVKNDADVFILLEYMRGGELSTRISCGPKLSESNAKFYFYQIVLAVQYLHSVGIIHRDLKEAENCGFVKPKSSKKRMIVHSVEIINRFVDSARKSKVDDIKNIKPGNILLLSPEAKTLLKVTDFGLSFILEDYQEVMKTVCGTVCYMAPEVLNPSIKEYNSQVDIWSMGVILFYMLSRQLPFQSRDRATVGGLILRGKYSMQDPLWYEISHQAKDLISKLLKVNPMERITIPGILSHPWIEKDHLMQFMVENMMKKEIERTQQTTFN